MKMKIMLEIMKKLLVRVCNNYKHIKFIKYLWTKKGKDREELKEINGRVEMNQSSFNWICHDLNDTVLRETDNESCHVMLILTTISQTRKRWETIMNNAYALLCHLNFRLANLISETVCIWTTKAGCCEINQLERKHY